MNSSNGETGWPSSSSWRGPDSPSDGAGAPIRVLLVEDDGDQRAVLRELLNHGEFITTICATARVARSHFDAGERYDVVLTDLDLGPGESGLDLIGYLGASGDRTPVVVVTGHQEILSAGGALARPEIDDYLSKPYSSAELVARVRKVGLRRRVAEANDVWRRKMLREILAAIGDHEPRD